MLTDGITDPASIDGGIPAFGAAGSAAEGEYVCADCGYGIAVRRDLPSCPMCGGGVWERPATSPFAGGLL